MLWGFVKFFLFEWLSIFVLVSLFRFLLWAFFLGGEVCLLFFLFCFVFEGAELVVLKS